MTKEKTSTVAFASDLHGEKTRYSALAAFLEGEKPNALILGGDLFPNSTDREKAIDYQKEFINRPFRKFLQDASKLGIQVLLVLGNMDFSVVLNPVLALCREGLAISIHSAVTNLGGGFRVAGYPSTPPSPFKLKDFEKRDLAGDPVPEGDETGLISTDSGILELDAADILGAGRSIEEDLEYILDGILKPFVLVTHTPPKDTLLDMIGSEAHVGSSAVRAAILKHGPALSLHGHIHESFKISGSMTDKIGDTLCVNPGKGHKKLCLALFESFDPAGTLRFAELPLS